ncbi:MAG: TonB-dependent receptor [Prolixibacteraceae bacterium]
MNRSRLVVLISIIFPTQFLTAQTAVRDTVPVKRINLEEVVVSVNKTEELKKNIAQQVQVLDALDIFRIQAQSTADIVSNSGNVYIQKSQLGGGSVTIRGFEASRTLLVIDGVRMNNLIYRSGHLQNIVTTDNNLLDRIEILFGPSSTVYGSDALGGVVHLYTKRPALAGESRKKVSMNFFSRYGSVNNELSNHFDLNFGTKKFAALSSITVSKFGDLKGGTDSNPFFRNAYGERPYFVDRINGKDVLIENPDRFLQVQSGYSQYDLTQKFLIKQNEYLSHALNVQYSTSSDVPRYDRLTDPSGTGLKYAQWYYGPQDRFLTAYDLNYANPSGKFKRIHLGLNYQNLEESRHSRKFGKNDLSHRIENVNVFGANLDFQKIIRQHNLRFGFDGQFNTLESTANSEDISTGILAPLDTRYPDGENSMSDLAVYFSHTWKITGQLTLVDGIRGGYSWLRSTIADNSFFNLPFTEARQKTPVYSGNIGIIANPTDQWKLSFLISTGFRVPNIDDLSKIFESAPGIVIVPNPDLKPEKTVNYELGITKIFSQKTSWETALYYTFFNDAIVTDPFLLNGRGSIQYDGSTSQVFANQNREKAFITGFSSNLKSQFTQYLLMNLSLNYTYGRIKGENLNLPLDHIPPFLAHLSLSYTAKKFSTDFFINYNGWKRLNDYHLNGEDNEQYATPEGMPAWFILNIHGSYQVNKKIGIQAGIDNILDTQYRTFASGINAPGRNIFSAVLFHF